MEYLHLLGDLPSDGLLDCGSFELLENALFFEEVIKVRANVLVLTTCHLSVPSNLLNYILHTFSSDREIGHWDLLRA